MRNCLRRLVFFALALLVGGGTVVCLGLKVHRARQQRAAVESIRALGGTVYYAYQLDAEGDVQTAEPPAPAWLCRLVGEEFFSDVARVSLARMHVGDADLVHLDRLPDIEYLSLAQTDIRDDGLSHVAGLHRLRHLDLHGNWIGDRGLMHLRELDSLTALDLSDTQVTGEGMAVLKGLTTLKTLKLAGTHIDDDSLANLSGLVRLKDLDLSRTSVTNAGMIHLRDLVNLQHLNLRVTEVSIVGVFPLYRATDLRDIRFSQDKTAFEPWFIFTGQQELYATRKTDVPALIKQMHDDDPNIRIAIIEGLARYSCVSEEAASALLQRGIEDDDPSVRRAMVVALSGLDHVEAVDMVADALDDDNVDVRLDAVTFLESMSMEFDEATVALIEKGLTAEDASIRSLAAHALMDVSPPSQKSLDVLIARLEESMAEAELTPYDREMLAKALEKWKKTRKNPPPEDERH